MKINQKIRSSIYIFSGPLCEEPMAATAFVLQDWTGSMKYEQAENTGQHNVLINKKGNARRNVQDYSIILS